MARRNQSMKIDFSPSIYEHAASLINLTPYEVSRDGDLIYQAHKKAFEIYRHSPVVIGIDIYNVEAEAYGCVVEKPSGTGIPAITRGIIKSIDDMYNIKPFDPNNDGRIKMIVSAGKRLLENFPEADVRIPVSGPFSIAVNLRGITELLEDIALSLKKVYDLLKKLIEGQVQFCQFIKDSGLDVAFFESAAAPPLLSPKYFHEIELPVLKEIMQKVSEVVNHPIPCIIGGDTEPILDDILDTGTGYIICPIETDQYKFMKKFGNRDNVKVRINMDSRIIAYGSKDSIINEVDRILNLANGRPNILLGTGAVPYETPIDNILLIKEYVNNS
ncbi:MAG: uroporphyrinogen decarboxylase family protein [bacterium]